MTVVRYDVIRVTRRTMYRRGVPPYHRTTGTIVPETNRFDRPYVPTETP